MNLCQGFGEILTNDCDERNSHPIAFSHFSPCTEFTNDDSNDLYIVDSSNRDRYLADDPKVTRLKCLLLATATPIIHPIGLLLNLANRIAKLISFAHFWHPSAEHYSLNEKLWAVGKDLLRVASSPIIYISLELSALYGLFLPNQARKLYATFERCAFGKALLAPCFQPYATAHLGGAPGYAMNAW